MQARQCTRLLPLHLAAISDSEDTPYSEKGLTVGKTKQAPENILQITPSTHRHGALKLVDDRTPFLPPKNRQEKSVCEKPQSIREVQDSKNNLVGQRHALRYKVQSLEKQLVLSEQMLLKKTASLQFAVQEYHSIFKRLESSEAGRHAALTECKELQRHAIRLESELKARKSMKAKQFRDLLTAQRRLLDLERQMKVEAQKSAETASLGRDAKDSICRSLRAQLKNRDAEILQLRAMLEGYAKQDGQPESKVRLQDVLFIKRLPQACSRK